MIIVAVLIVIIILQATYRGDELNESRNHRAHGRE